MAVADHETLAALVTSRGVLCEEFVGLGIDGSLQHLAGSLADDLIQWAPPTVELLSEREHFGIDGAGRRSSGRLRVPAGWRSAVGCRSLMHGVSFPPSSGC